MKLGLFAQPLNTVDDLACQPALDQRIVKCTIKCHRDAILPADEPAFHAFGRNDQVVFAQGHRRALDVHGERPVAHEGSDIGIVQRSDRRRGGLHLLAQTLAQRLEVGFHPAFDQIALAGHELDGIDVDFVAHGRGDRFDVTAGHAGLLDHQNPGHGLADVDAGLVTKSQRIGHDRPGQAHAPLQIGVGDRAIAHGEIGQVHGGVCPRRRHHLTIKPIGEKRRDRRHHGCHIAQAGQRGVIRRALVGDLGRAGIAAGIRACTRPETSARAPDIPVGQTVDEALDGACGPRGIVGIQRGRGLRGGGLQARENPAIQLGPLVDRRRRRIGGEPVDIGVGGKERVDVFQRAEDLGTRFAQRAIGILGVVPRLGAGQHVPTDDVRAVGVQGLERIDRIALGLGHLLAARVQQQAVDDDVLVSRRILDQRADGMQRIEPAAGLIHALADEIRRKIGLEQFLVLERVMPLGKRHGARIEPDIDDFRHAPHGAAVGGLPGHGIDLGLVQIQGVIARHLVAGIRPQFGDRADDHDIVRVGIVDPDRQRRAPVAMPRERPVHIVGQPIAETPRADMWRMPIDLVVIGHQPVLVRLGGHEPGLDRIVHEWRALAPVVRVIVNRHVLCKEPAALLEITRQRLVGVLEPLAAHQWEIGPEMPVVLHRIENRQTGSNRYPIIVAAERRRHMHDAGAVLGRDEITGDDTPGIGCAGELAHEIEGRTIARADQFRALEGRDDLGGLAQRGRDTVGGQNIARPLVRGTHIVDIRRHGQPGIGWDRPGRGGPRQQRHIRLLLEEELDRDRRILNLLVAETHLMRGQHRTRTRRIPMDLVALVEQALLVELGQQPPDGFDVLVGEGHIGRVKIHPVADTSGELVPLMLVAQHRLPAGRVVFGDAVGLDVLARFQAELFLDLDLYRQTVGIPAGLAIHTIALHRLVTTKGVLDRAPQDVMDTGPAVGRRRAFIESEVRAVGPGGGRGLEHAGFIPPGTDIGLDGRQVQGFVLGKTAHGVPRLA